MQIEQAVRIEEVSKEDGQSLLRRFGVTLRALLMALSMLAFGWGLTTGVGVIAGVLGAIAGVYAGEWLARTRLRTWMLYAWIVVGGLVCAGLSFAFGAWSWLVELLGGGDGLACGGYLLVGGRNARAARGIACFGGAFSSVGECRVDVAVVWGSFVVCFTPRQQHPSATIPCGLGFGTWRRSDLVSVVIGVGAAILMVLGLIRVRQRRQIVGVAVLVLFLISSVLWFLSGVGAAKLDKFVNRLQGKGDDKQGKKKEQEQQRKKQQDEMPFDPPPPQNQQQPQPEPVAVVVFRDDYRPKRKVLYFRQKALSFYNGLRMEKGSHKEIHNDTMSFFPDEGVMEHLYAVRGSSQQAKDGKPLPQLQGDRKRVRTRVSLLREHTHPFGLLDPTSFQGIANPNPRVFVRAYEVDSMADDGEYALTLKVGDPRWSKDLWQHYTAGPQDQSYKDLLAEILSPLSGKHANNLTAKAFLIKMWLDKHTLYSLHPPSQERIKGLWDKHRERIEKGNPWVDFLRNHPSAKKVSFPDPRYEELTAKQDPVRHFLFRSRIGYCVHLSHSSVFLMRLAGIPARIGEGYATPDDNRGSTSSLLIRDNEAHAWPELYFEGIGWVPMDPSPQALREQRQPPPDPQLRQTLAKLSRNTPPPPPKIGQIKNPKQDIDPILRRREPLRINLFPFLWALILGLYALKFGRRVAFWFAIAGGERRLRWFLMSLEDRFCELGMRRPVGESLEVFADRFEQTIPALRPIVEQLSALRLGSRLPPKVNAHDLLACQVQISKTFAWYRQVFGFLDPVSWCLHLFDRWRVLPPAFWVRWKDAQAKRAAKKAEKRAEKKRRATPSPAVS